VTIDEETGTATIPVTEEALVKKAEEAIEGARETGGRESVVNIVQPPVDADGNPVESSKVEVELPVEGLKRAVERAVENDIDLRVNAETLAGEVALNTNALMELIAIAEAENAATVDIVVTKGKEALAKDLNEAQNATLYSAGGEFAGKTRDVFDISLYAGGKRLENFRTPTGTLTVGLPYELRAGEIESGVEVRWLGKDGSTERMIDGRKYDGKKELAIFKTGHLSIYAVVYEEENETAAPGTPEDPGESESKSSGGGCDTGGLGAAGTMMLLALGTTLFTKRARPQK
jgi:hypothetical protein